MLEAIVPAFDKFHFIVYQNLIKLCGYHNETQFENVYFLTFIQFFSCIIMSCFVMAPFFVVLTLLYIYYQTKTKNNINAKSKESENEEYTKNSLIDEKLVNVTEEKITNRFETAEKNDKIEKKQETSKMEEIVKKNI